jgi:hypothetical protein
MKSYLYGSSQQKCVDSLRMQNFSLTQCPVANLIRPFLILFCSTHLSHNIRKAEKRMRDHSVNPEAINNTVIVFRVNFSTHSARLSETALVSRQRGLRKQMVKECSSLTTIKHRVCFNMKCYLAGKLVKVLSRDVTLNVTIYGQR